MTQASHLLRALGIICDVNDYHAVLEWRNMSCAELNYKRAVQKM